MGTGTRLCGTAMAKPPYKGHASQDNSRVTTKMHVVLHLSRPWHFCLIASFLPTAPANVQAGPRTPDWPTLDQPIHHTKLSQRLFLKAVRQNCTAGQRVVWGGAWWRPEEDRGGGVTSCLWVPGEVGACLCYGNPLSAAHLIVSGGRR